MTGIATTNPSHKLYSSAIVTVATDIIQVVSPIFTDYQVGVRYYSDAAGTPVTPGAGTVAIQRLDEATNQLTAVTGSPLTGTDVTDKVVESANSLQIKAVTTGITTATHYQLFISANV